MAGLKRRLPRVSEVARFVGPTFRRRTTDRWSRVRTVADFERLINTVFDPSVTMADSEWLRSYWSGSIVVKGFNASTTRKPPYRQGRTVSRFRTTVDVSWIGL